MLKMLANWRSIFYLMVLVIVTACGGRGYVPIQDLTVSTAKGAGEVIMYDQAGQVVAPENYVVKAGDTLIAIAWRYGWDYKRLAKLNNISPPYTIYVGQNLVFKASNKVHSTKKQQVAAKASMASEEKVVSSQPVSKPLPQYNGVENLRWQWPLRGDLLATYNSKSETSKGVDIAAPLGTQVRAAAAGQVVYAGNGIQGYGNLLIIKHNDTYLSAYAYNSQLLVGEGDIVTIGQVIAQSGQGPKLDGRLHFEIRKDGRPVNPQAYLK